MNKIELYRVNIFTMVLPPPPTLTSGSSVGTPPPATAKNNEEPPPSSLIIPKAPQPISQKKKAKLLPSPASLAKRLGMGNLSNVVISTFLTTHLGTDKVDTQEFERFRDFVRKKEKYLRKQKESKKESHTLSDNEALNILKRSL